MKIIAWIACTLLFPLTLQARDFSGVIDDSDLSPPRKSLLGSVPLELTPDRVETSPIQGILDVQVLRDRKGQLIPVEGLSFTGLDKTSCPSKTGMVTLKAKLEESLFAVGNGSDNYTIVIQAPCGQLTRAIFNEDSSGGQALGIWQTAWTAKTKLSQAVGLGFWKRQIEFKWPDGGDYYFFDVVHLTRGDQWDVVGHELGHAIYDQARHGSFGGGQHKIDECYSEALALSEGWASFFSGWLNVDLSDPDAKFEYMVPRRAPLRFENVPADVCSGQNNEWRVTAFFWDLIDLNNDGEQSQSAFAKVWSSMEGKMAKTTAQAATQLQRDGINSGLLDIAWELSFKTQRP